MSQKNTTISRTEGIGILVLQRSVTNPLDLELIHELSEALHVLAQDDDMHGLVLTSANDKFFSIGFDIPALYGLSIEEFRIFYQAFNRLCIQLFSFPRPVIAAISGHAVAGGCILALCCDYRYIAEGNRKMGLNEIKLGVPIPFPADCILREIAGYRTYRDVVDTGDFFLPDQLLPMGLVDRVIAVDVLRTQAVEKMKTLGDHAPKAFLRIKQNRTVPVVSKIYPALLQNEEYFLTCWYAPLTRKRLQAAMKKF